MDAGLMHPLSAHLKQTYHRGFKGCKLRASTRRGLGEIVDTVWLVCVWQSGRWWPRQDLPPCFDEVVARHVARDQTRLTEQKHQAKAFTAQP